MTTDVTPIADNQVVPARMVVGFLDSSLTITDIAPDGPEHLGIDHDVVGHSLRDLVHPDSVEAVEAAATAAEEQHASVAVEAYVGCGPWARSLVRLTPMTATGHDGLVFVVTAPEGADDGRRAELEERLGRIAAELQAIGMVGRAPRPAVPIAGLSSRQEEILRRIVDGQRVPTIARDLFVSPSTVRNHLTAIFAKVGVHSQAELVEHVRSPERALAS